MHDPRLARRPWVCRLSHRVKRALHRSARVMRRALVVVSETTALNSGELSDETSVPPLMSVRVSGRDYRARFPTPGLR